MVKIISKVSVFILINILLILLILVSVIKLIPPQFDDLYQTEIVNKIKRLHQTQERKVIYVSGSSGAFCIDSKKISDYIGIEFVNLGLHAGFGHYFIDSIAKSGVNEGDIVVLAHEIETYYTDYYKENIGLLALGINENFEYTKYFSKKAKKDFIEYLPAYVFKKINKLIYEGKDDDGAYTSRAFNEYGDIFLELPYQKNDYYHNISKYNKDIDLNTVRETQEFIRYVNEKGAYFVIAFPYMKTRKEEKIDNGHIKEIEQAFKDSFKVKILYSFEKAIKNEEYFYDTANHCNTWGKEKYSEFLAKQIKKYMEDENI